MTDVTTAESKPSSSLLFDAVNRPSELTDREKSLLSEAVALIANALCYGTHGPLTRILANAQLLGLTRNGSDPFVRDKLDEIEQAVRLLHEAIDTIGDVAASCDDTCPGA